MSIDIQKHILDQPDKSFTIYDFEKHLDFNRIYGKTREALIRIFLAQKKVDEQQKMNNPHVREK